MQVRFVTIGEQTFLHLWRYWIPLNAIIHVDLMAGSDCKGAAITTTGDNFALESQEAGELRQLLAKFPNLKPEEQYEVSDG